MNLIGSSAPIRIGLWLDDLKLGIRAGLKAAAPMGLDEMGLDALGPEVLPNVLSQSGRKDLAHHIRHAGAALTALKADVGGRRLADAAALDVNLGRLHEAFELARGLNARRIVVSLGFVPPDAKGPNAKPRGALIEAVKALVIFGASTGVRPTVLAGGEPPGDLAAFLKECDTSEMLDVDLNPGGFVSRGVEPLAALNTLSSRVAIASAADYFRGGGEASFGKGDVPWGEVVIGLSTLSRADKPALMAACSRECDRRAALAETVKGLKKLRANPLG